MPDVREFQPVVESAERAAAAGDFAGAEALLREAADLQEASLGPRHPDLASTYNNLAVACEMADKPADAEQFYRRAYAIAASALGPEHPLAVTSRDNLRDFCKARGLSFEELATGAVPATAAPVTAVHVDAVPAAVRPPPDHSPVRSESAGAPPESGAAPARRAPPPAPARPSAPAARAAGVVAAAPTATPAGVTSSRRFVAVLLIIAVLAAIAVARQWLAPSSDADAPARASVRDGAPAAPSPASPSPASPSPASSSPPSPSPADSASAGAASAATAATPPPPTASAPGRVPAAAEPSVSAAPSSSATPAAGVRVVSATVCRTLTTAAGAWRCEAASADSGPGRFSYLTRIASPRPVRVRHRWYQGDRLRQDVGLAVGASPREGYRTFSRQSVGAGEWRVDLVAENGAVLDSTRFVVR